MSRLAPDSWFVRLAFAAAALCLVVAVFGAFVRLSHAGLSCPDWPTCYGKATWPVHEHEIDAANVAFPERAVEVSKAWREQVHRHLVSVLGLLVLALAFLAVRNDRIRRWLLLTSVLMVGCAIPLYMRQEYMLASVLAIAGEALLLYAALGLSRDRRSRLILLILALVIFQALLGMWTVTWKLKPIVVTAHLLGGLSTFLLLSWLAWSQRATVSLPEPGQAPGHSAPGFAAVLLVFVLLFLQITLGGWVSSNYAALACPDFPTCQGQWWPQADFREGFVLWRGIGADYEGGILDAAARTAIHLTHRIGALFAGLALLWLGWRLLRSAMLRGVGATLLVLVLAQIGLGIANVVLDLPLPVAVAHHAGAVLLMGVFAYLFSRYRPAHCAPMAELGNK